MTFAAAATSTSATTAFQPQGGLFPPPHVRCRGRRCLYVRHRHLHIGRRCLHVPTLINRENPINDSSGIMEISGDGNLVIFNGQNNIVWSSNVSTYVANSSAQILDTGNLVLYNSNGGIVWESFLHASDSLVEKMKIITDLSTKERNIMTSSRSSNNTGCGRFTLGTEPSQMPQNFVWKDGYPYWRSGPWNGHEFNGIATTELSYKRGLHFVSDHPGSGYFIFTLLSSVLIYDQLNASGIILEKRWNDKIRDWEVTWTSQESECDVYGKCGNFGVCYAAGRPMCSCFPGFDPRSNDTWVQENKIFTMSECLNNCSCIAYAYYAGVGCMMWDEGLIDVQKFSSGGADLYIRLVDSKLGNKKDQKAIVATTVVLGIIFISACAYFLGKSFLYNRGGGGSHILFKARHLEFYLHEV
ncbi:hypothetical protein BUALT_Bualt18G0105800 [Buddleja alternifolia]|uniref:Bulb-type lectin domain-containing protein n=1 Tax=Buddleja alternifolia TaxID=168488 RepID=A0AAV6WDP9_9LAMI|nr:hypothetical protein BUALT_Bualt18G0105800 [Buddleja alternifolia]